MANFYIASPNLGILIALSIALHNIPEEFAISVLLIASKAKLSTPYKTAFISGLAEPAGAIIGLIAIGIAPTLTPFFLAFSAGAMLFVYLHELFPIANRIKREKLFALGAIASLLTYFLLRTIIPE